MQHPHIFGAFHPQTSLAFVHLLNLYLQILCSEHVKILTQLPIKQKLLKTLIQIMFYLKHISKSCTQYQKTDIWKHNYYNMNTSKQTF
jgi:hypothetical protein